MPTHRYHACCVDPLRGLLAQADGVAELEAIALAHLYQTGHDAVEIVDMPETGGAVPAADRRVDGAWSRAAR